MSQPGNYRYQTYDQSNSLKGGIPPLMNGQPNATQATQNGMPPASFSSAGKQLSFHSLSLSPWRADGHFFCRENLYQSFRLEFCDVSKILV